MAESATADGRDGRTVELVVTDLDGTLWHTDDQVHPATVAALRELRSRPVHLLVATGRRIGSTRRPLARLGWQPPAVVLNGAVGLELEDASRFHLQPFTTEAAVATLGAFREVGIDPAVYVDHQEAEVFISTTPGTSAGHIAGLGSECSVADLEQVVREAPVLSFALIGTDYEPCRQVEKRVEGIATAALDRSLDFGGAALIVSPLGLSKWDGVVAYCRYRGLDPGRILAIGDGPNDVELLSRAAVAVSLEGSHPDALATAAHVLPPARDGGWSGLLDLVGP